MLASACLQGREQEVTIADLVHVASEEQQAWFQQKGSYQVFHLHVTPVQSTHVPGLRCTSLYLLATMQILLSATCRAVVPTNRKSRQPEMVYLCTVCSAAPILSFYGQCRAFSFKSQLSLPADAPMSTVKITSSGFVSTHTPMLCNSAYPCQPSRGCSSQVHRCCCNVWMWLPLLHQHGSAPDRLSAKTESALSYITKLGCLPQLFQSLSMLKKDSVLQLVEGRAPQQCVFRIQSIDGSLVSHETLCKEGDMHFAVISIACGEAFDDGALDESSLHWACTPRQGGPWEGPPPGWTTDPSNSQDAGMFPDLLWFYTQSVPGRCSSLCLAGSCPPSKWYVLFAAPQAPNTFVRQSVHMLLPVVLVAPQAPCTLCVRGSKYSFLLCLLYLKLQAPLYANALYLRHVLTDWTVPEPPMLTHAMPHLHLREPSATTSSAVPCLCC